MNLPSSRTAGGLVPATRLPLASAADAVDWSFGVPLWRAPDSRFVSLLAAASADAFQESITPYHPAPRWQRVERETEREGDLHAADRTFDLAPIDSASFP